MFPISQTFFFTHQTKKKKKKEVCDQPAIPVFIPFQYSSFGFLGETVRFRQSQIQYRGTKFDLWEISNLTSSLYYSYIGDQVPRL